MRERGIFGYALNAFRQPNPELDVLSQIHDQNPSTEEFLRTFEQQLREQVECSRLVQKPIVF